MTKSRFGGRPWMALIVLVSVGFMLPSAKAWSAITSSVLSQRHSFASFSSSASPHLSLPRRQQRPRSFSMVQAVQASAVDMEDRKSIDDIDGHAQDTASFEASLDTNPSDEDTEEMTQKILNFVFLAACFGWAAYTILNIDAGMTRGWTQGEIAMRIPLDNWSNYESSLMSKPIFTKTLINVVIYLLGDWLSQTIFQKKNVLDFDVSRTLKNGFIGLCFGPLVHEYYAFSDHILPVEGGLMNRVEKIFMDQTIYLTVKCSIYICAVGLLSGDNWDTCQQTVKDKIGGIVITAWKFWPLIHCITYGVIPARHRILWVNSVDLIWNAILATQAQKDQPEDVIADEFDPISEAYVTVEADGAILATTNPDEISSVEQTVDVAAIQNESKVASLVKEVALTGPAIGVSSNSTGDVAVVAEEKEVKVATSATATSSPDDNVTP